MKKRLLIFLLLFLLIFPLISAAEINMKNQISQGETIMVSVSGNFIDPITESNIQFYRGHVKTAFDYKVAKIGDVYYIYAQSFGKLPNNYSVNISGVRYFVNFQVFQAPISKSFKIINETADFSVNPGFVLEDGNFSLKLQNFQSPELTISIDTEINYGTSEGSFDFLFEGEEAVDSIVIRSGQIKSLNVILNGIYGTTIRTIKLSTNNLEYEIPVYLILQEYTETPKEENNSEIPDETDTEEPDNEECSFFNALFGKCPSDSENEINDSEHEEDGISPIYSLIKINNTRAGQITRFSIKITDETALKPYGTYIFSTNNTGKWVNSSAIKFIENPSKVNVTKILNSTSGTRIGYRWYFNDSAGNKNSTLIYQITATTTNQAQNQTDEENEESDEESSGFWDIFKKKNTTTTSESLASKTCLQIKGKVCSSGEICSNATVKTKDANCCISSCVKQEENPNKKIIGWLIVGVLFIVVLWFFRIKFRGTKHKIDPMLNNKRR